MAVLTLQPCKRKGPNWPVFSFFGGAISDFNTGFPQWCALAETLPVFINLLWNWKYGDYTNKTNVSIFTKRE